MSSVSRPGAGVFPGLARAAQRHAGWWVAGWLLLAAFLGVVAPSLASVGVQDQSLFLPRGAPSQTAVELLDRAFPQDPSNNSAVVVVERSDGLTGADRTWLAQLSRRLDAASRQDGAAVSRVLATGVDPRAASLLRSTDGRAELMVVGYRPSSFSQAGIEALDQLKRELDSAPAGLTSAVTGIAGLSADQDAALRTTFDRVGLVSVALVVLILLLVYRSPVAAAVPLVTIAVSFAVAQSLVALLAQAGLQVASLAATFMIVLVFGAGTDYCLFLVSRYRAELASGDDRPTTLLRTTDVIAGVIIASGATVVIGFLAQFTAEFGFYRTMGPAIAIAVLVTMAAALTLTPALLTLLGRRAFWPVPTAVLRKADEQPYPRWERVGRLVRAWPAELALASIIPMVLLSGGIAALTTSTNLLQELPADAQARTGAETIARHYPAGASAPLSVIVAGNGPIAGAGRLAAVDRLTDALRATPGVAQVRSATQPAGAPLTARKGGGGAGADLQALGLDPNRIDVTPLYSALASGQGLRLTDDVVRRYPQLRSTTEFFTGAGGTATRLVVVLDGDPFGQAAQATVRRLQAVSEQTLGSGPLARATVSVAGPAAVFGDIETTAGQDFLRIALVLSIAILLVLTVLLRSLLLPVLLVGTALLSYTAALGFTAVVGRYVLGQDGVAFYLPAFLLVILVALGADYNIFITSRIREERDAGHPIDIAAVRGLVATGPVISNAGLILAGTFAALVLAPMPTLQQVGIAVAFGVLLDTFVVRPLLVPALIILLGRHAFWPQGSSARAFGVSPRRLQVAGTGVLVTALLGAVGFAVAPSNAADGPRTAAEAVSATSPTPRPVPTTTSAAAAAPPPGRPAAKQTTAAAASASPRRTAATASPTVAAPASGTSPTAARSAAPPAAGGGASRPSASSPSAKPTAATRIAAPEVGGWTYAVRGTRKVGAAGSRQAFSEQAVTQVTRTGGSPDAPQLRLRTETNSGTQQQDRRYAQPSVQLLATDMSSAGLSYGGTFSPPQDLIRWPVREGARWSSEWSLGSVSGRTDTVARGTRTVTVAARSHTCYVIESQTTFRGDAQGTQDTTSCWVAELGMAAQERQVFKGSYNGVPFDTDATATLRSGP